MRAGQKDIQQVHYGQLLAVLELPLQGRVWKDHAGSTVLLAIIRPCKTNGKDATQELTLYREYAADVVVDVNAVEAVVGRVKSRKEWGIIDRSGALARTVFTADVDAASSAADREREQDDLPWGWSDEEDSDD